MYNNSQNELSGVAFLSQNGSVSFNITESGKGIFESLSPDSLHPCGYISDAAYKLFQEKKEEAETKARKKKQKQKLSIKQFTDDFVASFLSFSCYTYVKDDGTTASCPTLRMKSKSRAAIEKNDIWED